MSGLHALQGIAAEPPPKGEGGVEVVYKNRVVAAYEWLGKGAPPEDKIP
jgi:hypothetical protein